MLPSTSPDAETAIVVPAGRGAELQVPITVASANGSPRERHAIKPSTMSRIGVSSPSVVNPCGRILRVVARPPARPAAASDVPVGRHFSPGAEQDVQRTRVLDGVLHRPLD